MNPLQKFCCSVGVLTLVGLSGLERAIAAPKGWVQVSRDNDLVYYIDNGTIQGKGRYRYFWLYANHASGNPVFAVNGKTAYGMSGYFSTDCQQGLIRLRSAQAVDQNSQVIAESHQGEQGQMFQISSQKPAGIAVRKYVCSQRR